MGEAQNQPFQLSFNASLKIDFQGSRVTSDGGLDPGARTRRATRVRRIDRAASDGLPPGQEHAVPANRLAAAVGVQSLGRIRGRERCGTAVPRSDLSAHRFGKELGSRSGLDLAAADFETEMLAE